MTAAMAMQWDAVLAVDEVAKGRGYGQGAGWGDGDCGWDGMVVPETGLLTAGAGVTVDKDKLMLWVMSFAYDEEDDHRAARDCLMLKEVRQ